MVNVCLSFGLNLILAAITPAKVTDVEANYSTESMAKGPEVIYGKTFSMRTAPSNSQDGVGQVAGDYLVWYVAANK